MADVSVLRNEHTAFHAHLPQEPPLSEIIGESRVPQILVGVTVPFVIGTLFVAARLYSRLAILKIWKADDWLLTAGWVS